MKYKLIASIVCIGMLIAAFTEKTICFNNQPQSARNYERNTVASKKNHDQIMNTFNQLNNDPNTTEKDMIKFVNNNIKKLSKEDASQLVIGIENIMSRNYASITQTCFNGDIQNKLRNEFKDTNSINIQNSKDILDEELKNYLLFLSDSGYKLVFSENKFFPVIDYNFFQKYISYVSEDMVEYIKIQTLNSQIPLTKNGVLNISLDDIFDRIIKHEYFIKNYPDSLEINTMKNQYVFYFGCYLYGVQNTHTFNYKTNKLNDDVLKSYKTSISKYPEAESTKILNNYMKILESNDFQLTDKVDSFRKDTIKNLNTKYLNKNITSST